MVDRSDIAAVVEEMYNSISGPAGPRDWSRQAEIFHPDARQIRTGQDGEGGVWYKMMSIAEYAADTTPFFAANAFYETEIGHRIHVFGNIAHVWSAYEARPSPDDAEPERRGINSIQLLRDTQGEWRIIAMIWDNERPGIEVPKLEPAEQELEAPARRQAR